MKIAQYAWGLLILRLVLGFNFAMHGFAKFDGGIENTSRWFESLGLPGILAYGVALLEVLGGFGLMIGLFTRMLSFLYMIVMVVAIYKVRLSSGFLGGWELEFTFFSVALALLVTGGGVYSADHSLFPSKKILRLLQPAGASPESERESGTAATE